MSFLLHSTVRLSELDPLTEWDLGTVMKLADTLDSIPAYRYSASKSQLSLLGFGHQRKHTTPFLIGE